MICRKNIVQVVDFQEFLKHANLSITLDYIFKLLSIDTTVNIRFKILLSIGLWIMKLKRF